MRALRALCAKQAGERAGKHASGRVSELLKPARYIAADAMLPVARVFNPDDGRAPTASITECLY